MLRPKMRLYLHVPKKICYSTVVNRSNYRPDNLAKREMDVGQTPAVSGQFDGTSRDLNTDSVPLEVIWLREGRLTQTEVDNLRDAVRDKAMDENYRAEIEMASAQTRSLDKKVASIVNSISE